LPLWLSTAQPPAVTILEMPPRVTPRKSVPVFLVEWREHLGLKQQQVGDAFEPPTDKGTISRYERDRRGLSLNVLAAYAEALSTLSGRRIPVTHLYRRPNDEESLDDMVARAPKALRETAREMIGLLLRRGR
jgi:transcriptional regulator with XRE-family HTH domain